MGTPRSSFQTISLDPLVPSPQLRPPWPGQGVPLSLLALLAAFPLAPERALRALLAPAFSPRTVALYLDALCRAGLAQPWTPPPDSLAARLAASSARAAETGRAARRHPRLWYPTRLGLAALRDLLGRGARAAFPGAEPALLDPAAAAHRLDQLAARWLPHHLLAWQTLAGLGGAAEAQLPDGRRERWTLVVAGCWRGGAVHCLAGRTRRPWSAHATPFADLLVLLALLRHDPAGQLVAPPAFRLACLEIERGFHGRAALLAKARRYGAAFGRAQADGRAPDVLPLLLLVLDRADASRAAAPLARTAHSLAAACLRGGAALPVLATLPGLLDQPGGALGPVWAVDPVPWQRPSGLQRPLLDARGRPLVLTLPDGSTRGLPLALHGLGPAEFVPLAQTGAARLPAPCTGWLLPEPLASALAAAPWQTPWPPPRAVARERAVLARLLAAFASLASPLADGAAARARAPKRPAARADA